jgi:thiamine thiazole synthase
MFNEIVVQKDAKAILEEMDIAAKVYKAGYYVADSVEAVSGLIYNASKAGLTIFNLLSAEDVMVRKNKVCGLVLNWSSVEMAGLHIDPIALMAKYVIDATGHPSEIAHLLEKKQGVKLKTKTGKVIGERSMWADVGEKSIINNTLEIYPGVYVAGMAANAVFGGQRMGPIFGGMLLSGKKVAAMLDVKLKGKR